MSYLIDTNVISEIRKGARCDVHVSAWYASIASEEIFLSTLVLGEIRKGAENARPRDPGKAAAIERWLLDAKAAFNERVFGIDDAVAGQWGAYERDQAGSGYRWTACGDGPDPRAYSGYSKRPQRG